MKHKIIKNALNYLNEDTKYLLKEGALVGPEHGAGLLDERAVVDLLDEGTVLDFHDVGAATRVANDWAVSLPAQDGAAGGTGSGSLQNEN